MERQLAEEKRQAEEQAKIELEKKTRRSNLQYSGIFIFIIALFAMVFVLGRFTIPIQLAEALIFIPFLIIFEFLLVFLDPYIEVFTGGEPTYKLAINAGLAFVIFPLHQYFEGNLKFRAIKVKRRKIQDSIIKIILVLCIITANIQLLRKEAFGQNPETLPQNEVKELPVSPKADSLINQLQTATEDTIKINILSALCLELKHYDPPKALVYGRQGLAIAKKLNHKTGILLCSNILGAVCMNQGNYEQVIIYWQQSLRTSEELGDDNSIAETLNDIGEVNRLQGNFPKALDYYLQALKKSEELFLSAEQKGDKDEITKRKQLFAGCLSNVGIIYYYQNDLDKTIDYFLQSLKIWEETGDQYEIARSLDNLGVIYYNKGYNEKALEYHQKSLKIKEELGDKRGIASSLNNIGEVNRLQGNFDRALDYQKQSLKIKQELNDSRGIANSLNNIGETYYDQGNYAKAIESSEGSLEIAKEIAAKELIKNAYQNLVNCNAKSGHFNKAYKYNKLYVAIKDTLFNEEKAKEIGKLEARYEMEKKITAEKRLAEEQVQLEAEKISRRNNLQYSGIFIFIIALFGAMFAMGKFRIPIRLVEAIVFIPFLIFFEFLLVFLDPYIEASTGNEPAYKLGINAVIAGIIFPLHQFMEGDLKKRVLLKKRKISRK